MTEDAPLTETTDTTDVTAPPPRRLTLAAVSHTWVPFALLLGAGLLAAEVAPNLDLGRTVYSLWVSLGLAGAALAVYAFAHPGAAFERHWRLFWTVAYLAYLVHVATALTYLAKLYFTTGLGPYGAALDHLGLAIAAVNTLLTVWWGVDVVLSWLTRAPAKWIRWQRLGVHVLALALFFVSASVFRGGFVAVLGWLMLGSVVVTLIWHATMIGPLHRWRPAY